MKTLKIAATISATALLALGVSACSPSEPPAPTVTVTATPTPEATPGLPEVEERAKTIYLDAVHRDIPWTVNEADTDLLLVGNMGCQAFSQGKTWDELLTVLYSLDDENDIPVADSRLMIAYGVGSFCPEYTDKFVE